MVWQGQGLGERPAAGEGRQGCGASDEGVWGLQAGVPSLIPPPPRQLFLLTGTLRGTSLRPRTPQTQHMPST